VGRGPARPETTMTIEPASDSNSSRRTVTRTGRPARLVAVKYSEGENTPDNARTRGPGPFDCETLLLCLFDANPSLSEGARESLVAAAALAKKNEAGGGATGVVLLCAQDADASLDERNQAAVDALAGMGVRSVQVVKQDLVPKAEVVIGDVVDQEGAGMVILPWETLHYHSIDANLLSEFVSCPVLLLP